VLWLKLRLFAVRTIIKRKQEIPMHWTGRFGVCVLLTVIIALTLAYAQEASQEKSKPSVKKTAKGIEVTLLEARKVDEYEPGSHVPMFRMGSCPPGTILPDLKELANPGQDVVVILLALKFSPEYEGPDFSNPVLLDASGEKYVSRSMFQTPEGLVKELKKTGEQVRCEIPFAIPEGTVIKKVQFDDAVFEVEIKNPSQR
jgi:hypothetical protein